jgi:hypothetical protein
MAAPDACVAYLVRIDEGLAPVERFLRAYSTHDPGMPHRFMVLRRGFRTEGSWAPFASAFDANGQTYQILDLPDAGFDLGAYRAAVGASSHEYVCFLNTFSEVLCDGWLEHLHQAAQRPDVGLAGATGSYESISAAVAAATSVQPRGRTRWWRPQVRAHVRASRLRMEFPPYPNPHVRTNGFMVRRTVALALRWGPYRTKTDALRGESGRFGLSRQAETLGLRNVIVGRDGVSYETEDWPSSGTFRCGDQSNLMIADNRTREYAASSDEERERLGQLAWGAQYRACASKSP